MHYSNYCCLASIFNFVQWQYSNYDLHISMASKRTCSFCSISYFQTLEIIFAHTYLNFTQINARLFVTIDPGRFLIISLSEPSTNLSHQSRVRVELEQAQSRVEQSQSRARVELEQSQSREELEQSQSRVKLEQSLSKGRVRAKLEQSQSRIRVRVE